MPVSNFLTKEQKKSMRKAMREDECPHFREHILIILLANDGKTQSQIAEFVGCSLRTVSYWFNHGDPDNLESFRDGRGQGNNQKSTPGYINLLIEIVEKDPTKFGYEFGRWTAQRLSEHLAKETGIALSSSQVKRLLKKNEYRYIWQKYSLEDRQKPKERQAFKVKLERWMEMERKDPDLFQIWFWDESGFSLRVRRGKQWTKKGRSNKVSGKRRRGRVNVMGGLRYGDKKRKCFFIEKGDGDIFLEQLKKINSFVREEWVGKGNRAEDFKKKGPKVILILDNASFHKRNDILEVIKKELPNIQLEFLPAYSPDYNLIELVWHSSKEYIAGRLFETVDQLQKLLDRLLNKGELEIKWSRKLKNKGNLVNAI
ncbi:IS630 family transposase [Okeania sp. SIO2B9]|uniref:IS630 family transposase n=1 Tax=Okeania sp. SIO2B9 TaxID=2607782 RepID=UPI00142A129E|nr:IS630 family transposase [Okeania sp. SIO2B9]NES93443.1 IS630 family transposase [Okeania sp. SIO2B9]